MFDGFTEESMAVGGGRIFVLRGGSGRPLLLLHGFPETHLMWRGVGPLLARDFTIFCADLPGYGASHSEAHSKRAMADELVTAMHDMAFDRFAVAGHDRGGRVAYRMALDHPDRIAAVAVLDVIPIGDAWAMSDSRLALAFWPWSLLAQPAPLPERLIAAAPEAVVDDAATQWGSASDAFPPEIRSAYAEPLRDPARAHAICEEFRAAATIDREHDEADRRNGRRIQCPLLALWDRAGALGRWYEDEGGPLAIWRRWADTIEGQPMDGGHFFPETEPDETARRLRDFFLRGSSRCEATTGMASRRD